MPKHSFVARVVLEGSKRTPRITVPTAVAQAMKMTFPGWIRFTVDDREPIFICARRPPSRTSIDVALPVWGGFTKMQRGQEVHVEVESAEPFAAQPSDAPFDWLRFVPDRTHCFATQESDELVLCNKYEEPVRIRRFPDIVPTYRLFGWWQAEGSKSYGDGDGSTTGAQDWSLANTNPLFMKAVVSALIGAWGIGPERLSLEIIRPIGYEKEKARRVFETTEALGVEVVAEREAGRRTEPSGTLRIRKSKLLMRMTRSAVEALFRDGCPSKETAQAFALTWLDGDGTITLGSTAIELRLAGSPEEHRVVLRALHQSFGWAPTPHEQLYDRESSITTRFLRARDAADLLIAGAFSFSASRVRLLLAYERRTAFLREISTYLPSRQVQHRGPLARWGLIEHVSDVWRLTADGQYVVTTYARLIDEINRVRGRLTNDGVTGKKGVQYPSC